MIFRSDGSVCQLSQIKLPSLELSLEFLEEIFLSPSIFLMNLSVCLLLKYSYYTRTILSQDNIGWIISVSTIIAYKIYYDNQMEDLMSYFADITYLPINELGDIERIFLEAIDYRTIIDPAQYQYVVAKIFENQK